MESYLADSDQGLARDIAIKITDNILHTLRSIPGDCGIGNGFYNFVSHVEVLPWIIDNMKESAASRRPTTTSTTTERTTTTTKRNPVNVTTNQPSASRKG